MTPAEKFELAIIPLFGTGLWLMTIGLPNEIGMGRLLLVVSVILLLQGLVRDLCLLAKLKYTAQTGPVKKARCMCVESTIGATGVVAGILMLGFGINQAVVMDSWIWSLLVMLVMTLGFLIKDYVMEWNPLRIRKDKDHMNIVFSWKE